MNKKLWTKNFTIITLGSAVSLYGNALAGFAASLLAYDMTKSSSLYAVFLAVFTLPQIVMPIFSGALLDRFSRRKAIYTLDFLSAFLYGVAALFLALGWATFPMLLIFCLIVGSIQSVYTVAYQSFYPLLIAEGQFSKAYSISSFLETSSSLMVPLSALAYNSIGAVPLFMINAVSFLVAAIMETRIVHKEDYLSRSGQLPPSGRRFLGDIAEGVKYLWTEKGLLAIAVYFIFLTLAGGVSSAVTLPFFKSVYDETPYVLNLFGLTLRLTGEYVYMIVPGMMIVGRIVGGIIHYFVRIPVKAKFGAALVVYLCAALIDGFYLYFNVPTMMGLCFIAGLLGITSYNIRISTTQSYVPDEKKGRFNGAFTMFDTGGSFAGELLAGALTVFFDPRYVLTGFMLVNFLAAIIFIGGGAKHVKKVYNRET